MKIDDYKTCTSREMELTALTNINKTDNVGQ